MATTVKSATLKVTVEEEISLNGVRQDCKNVVRISDINEIYKRIITCPANSETTLAHFHSSVADGTLAPLDIDDVKYIRVTNLDSSVSATLSLQSDVGEDDSAADESASLLLESGKSFMMGSPNDGIGISDADANLVTDLVDLESLVVFTGSDAVDVEIFIASV
jgi:hypothetical protein|tara:strand:- start:1313 stop:1804 length:492 start_codon:yes stop_codon:yes gene_type:complete